ncbi:MAG: hypothetical protein RLZZ524_3098 [Pseudomonadota bacterium]|jgi:hypothetical protein
MGYALIVGGGTDGRYTISLDIGEAMRDALVTRFTQQASAAQERLTVAQAELDAKTVTLNEATTEYNEATDAYIALQRGEIEPEDEEEFIAIVDRYNQAQAAYIRAKADHSAALANRNMLSHAKTTIDKALAGWQAQVLTETRDAWCTDFTEDATGYVATLDIPGESDLLLIAPGGRQPVLSTDGAFLSRNLMAPWQAYFNAAILPGWQKFKPTYRWGTITALDEDADTASVTLFASTSSAQRLSVNQASTLTNVPIVYMTCNASVFEVGDNVVVEFQGQDWNAPRVIGFLDNPRACNWMMIGGGYISVGRLSPFFAAFSEDSYELLSSATFEVRENRGDWIELVNDFPGGNEEEYSALIREWELYPGVVEEVTCTIIVMRPSQMAFRFPALPLIDGATAYVSFEAAGETGYSGPRPLSTFEVRARTLDQTLRLNVATIEIGWADENIPPEGKSAGGRKQYAGYVQAGVLDYQLFSETGD